MPAFGLEGMAKFEAKMKLLSGVVDAKDMENELLKAGRNLRNKIRARAPKGLTGNLRKGIVAKKFKRKIPGSPAVFVAIANRVAPHAHLIEFGTAQRRKPKKAKVLKFVINGQTVYAKSVKPMPAQPFFRPTVDTSHASIAKDIEKAVRISIGKAA